MTQPSPKKLVYILNYVHPSDVQHFVHVMALLRTLEERCGWEITLLSEKGGEGVQVVHGKEVRYLSRNGKISRLLSLATALTALRRDGYRLVFVRISKPAALVSSIVGKMLGMRVLYWQSTADFDLDRSKPLIKRFTGDLAMACIKWGIDRFVTGPEYMLRYYEENYKVPNNKLLLLYNDVDLNRFVPPAVPRAFDGVLKILFVHSLSPSKNAALYLPHIIERLNALAAEGQRIEFDLIGDGPERNQIAEQIKAAKGILSIRMLGAVANVDLPQHLAKADIFIMPSYREGMPRALMEAMAMRLPAVATDAGGTRDIVGPRQLEYIVSRDDPDAFAQRLVDLACDAEARRQIGEENLLHVQRYSTPVVADMYDRALSALL